MCMGVVVYVHRYTLCMGVKVHEHTSVCSYITNRVVKLELDNLPSAAQICKLAPT